MAGLPGGGRGPGGVPKFVSAPATKPVGDSTTYIARAPTFVPTWRAWVPPGGTYGFVDYSIGQPAAPPQAPFAQDDWPVPRGPLNRNLYGFIDYVSGLAPAVTPPDTTHIIRAPTFTPTWQPWRLENRGFVQSVPLTLRPPGIVAAPFSQDDWPNPVRSIDGRQYQKWTDYYSIQIIPFTSQGGNWDNPRGPTARHAGYQGWIDFTVQSAAVTPPDTTHILRAPVYTPRWSPYRIETLGFVQGLPLTLRPAGVVINPPIRLYDWPNPRGWPRPHVGFVTGETLKQPPPPTRTSDCLLLLEDSSGNLILEDFLGLLALELCGPFVTYDLSLPPRALGPRQDWLQNAYAARNTAVVITKPFLQTDWVNPRGAVSAHYGFGFGTNLGLLRPDIKPIRPIDWPNPLASRPSINLRTWVNGVVGSTPVVVVGQPFAQTDWPNPLRSPDRSLYQKWSDYYSIQIIPPTTNYDQPNPRLPQPNRADWIQGTTLTLRPPGVVQAPLRPLDWPNPRGLLPANAGFAAAINLGLLRPDVNPEINYDWPNPQAARRGVADWIQSAFAALQTSPPPPKPFNQTDWPVTLGRVGSHVGWTASTQLGLLRPDINPFIPRDFANPKAPQRGVDLYGWIQALSALIIPPPPPPTFPPNGQYNWPNPAGPQRGIDLFGWSQSPTALTLPPTPEPPVEVLQPGGRGVPHTFSRKKWRELQMLIAAEMAAVAKAEELTKRGKREALLQAARAAAAAVDAAEAEGENKRLDKLLVRNALTLRAAIRAASEVKLLRETASAIEQSRAIVQRQQDEEDEMINLLMLS